MLKIMKQCQSDYAVEIKVKVICSTTVNNFKKYNTNRTLVGIDVSRYFNNKSDRSMYLLFDTSLWVHSKNVENQEMWLKRIISAVWFG